MPESMTNLEKAQKWIDDYIAALDRKITELTQKIGASVLAGVKYDDYVRQVEDIGIERQAYKTCRQWISLT